MLMDCDSELKLMSGFHISLQKNLTQTMLNQQEIFRNQVCSLGSLQNHHLKEHRDTLELPILSLDLSLAVTQNTNYSEKLWSGGITPAFTEQAVHYYKDPFSDGLKPSLRAGGSTCQIGSGKMTREDVFICSPSPQSVQFVGSPYGRDHATILSCGGATNSGANNDFGTSCSYESWKNDSPHWIPEFLSLRDGRANLLETNHFYQGVEDLSCKNTLALRKLFPTPEVEELDLNKPLLTESSAYQFNSSQCTSSGVSHDEDITTSTLIISPSKDTCEHLCRTSVCSENFASVCGPLSECKDYVSCSRGFKPESVESVTGLPDETFWSLSTPELNAKEKKDDNPCSHYSKQELLECSDSSRLPSCKSNTIEEDVFSSKKKKPCLINAPNSKNFMVAKKSSTEMRSQLCYAEKEEMTEVNEMVRKGAVSLIHLSSQCLDENQDYSSESRKRKESCSVEKEVPQTSSESYSSIVLKQQECSIAECCISSTPFEVMGLDKNEHGVKLKRGRRMKDFRKDILPQLVSLSRREITEDIKIMEIALRSRDYKKYRSKNANKNECTTPVRSRRSRLGYP